jgi:hypothetical protein
MRGLKALSAPAFAAALLSALPAQSAIDPEDQKLIDAASCEEIVREHRNYSKAERDLDAEIRRSKATNVATNMAGIAAFATLGFGFVWVEDTSDAEEQLAEIREIRVAIGIAAQKKSCKL